MLNQIWLATTGMSGSDRTETAIPLSSTAWRKSLEMTPEGSPWTLEAVSEMSFESLESKGLITPDGQQSRHGLRGIDNPVDQVGRRSAQRLIEMWRHQQFGSENTFNGALIFALSDNQQVVASHSEGFRAPHHDAVGDDQPHKHGQLL